MKTWKRVLLPLTIAALSILATYGIAVSKPKPAMHDMGEVAPPKISVSVVKILKQTTTLNVVTHGTTRPRREIDVVSQVSGIVTAVEPVFVEGQFFSKQELLLQIDERDYKVAVLNAKARLADAERRLAEEEGMSRQAKREWRDLGNQNANDLFIRKPQLAAAKAALEFAKADLQRAQLDLERTRITVPFDGRIKETLVDLGQYVSPGTRLASVYDTAVAEIRLPLTDEQAALINLPITPRLLNDHEQRPAVTISGNVAGQRYTWHAEITRTDAFVDSNSRMLYAIAEVRDPFGIQNTHSEAPLLPGMFVEASIEGKQLQDIILLPRDALYKTHEIYIVKDDEKVELQSIDVLRKTKNQIWIRSSLPDGTLVVTEKQSLISPETLIQPILDGDLKEAALKEAALKNDASKSPNINSQDSIDNALDSANADPANKAT